MSRDWTLFLHDVVEHAEYVREFTRGMSFDDFRTDTKTQHAVLRDLQVIGEAVKRLPPDVLARHPEVPWRRIARFRDRLAHGSFDLDLDVVWDVVESRIPELLVAAQAIIRSLPDGGEQP